MGRPALPTRRVAGLLYLKHLYALSDEEIVERWVESPYFQHFCGERHFQHELPCDPSSLVRSAEQQADRYAHALQFRRMGGPLRKLRGWLGQVMRDIERKAGGSLPARLAHTLALALARRLRAQRREDSDTLCALHAPEVECIAKGKARTPYEFGVKVSVAVTAREGPGGMRSMPGNPYDGHTLENALEQVEILTATTPPIVLGDRGYHGVTPPNPATRPILSHTRRLPAALERLLKRRQVVEPVIGHMKADGLLSRSWVKGEAGDALHAVMCGAGHNLRLSLARLRAHFFPLIAVLAELAQSIAHGSHGAADRRRRLAV